MKAIQNRNDIEKLIATFYTKMAKDPELSPFFINIDLEKFKSVLANKINTLLDNYTMITTQVNLISNLKN